MGVLIAELNLFISTELRSFLQTFESYLTCAGPVILRQCKVFFLICLYAVQCFHNFTGLVISK